MVTFSLIGPIDQPIGTRRLLEDLKVALEDKRYAQFRLVVAYAKSGPLLRLQKYLEVWRSSGKKTSAIIGIDQAGTSKEALELALKLFDEVFITQEMGITFHPKMYIFSGERFARAFIGSNNLTVGGTEKNFESAVDLGFSLPADDTDFQHVLDAWTSLLPTACPATSPLTQSSVDQLVSEGRVLDEKALRSGRGNGNGNGDIAHVGRTGKRSGLAVKPESPLPASAVRAKGKKAAPASPATVALPTATRMHASAARGFAIQVKPHHNGEIFLSVSAALQNPSFFKWPFNGRATPKKPGNPAYPQMTPDPVVNITVYGSSNQPVLTRPRYDLNTVYYENRSEIRITASPLVGSVPEYSVMIMEPSDEDGVDYDITIHRPDSPDYQSWVDACNQTMPSGGSTPRKFGWF